MGCSPGLRRRSGRMIRYLRGLGSITMPVLRTFGAGGLVAGGRGESRFGWGLGATDEGWGWARGAHHSRLVKEKVSLTLALTPSLSLEERVSDATLCGNLCITVAVAGIGRHVRGERLSRAA